MALYMASGETYSVELWAPGPTLTPAGMACVQEPTALSLSPLQGFSGQ